MFKLLEKKKQAKMHWLQVPNQNNVENLNNIRCAASSHLGNKNKEAKI